MSRRKKNKLTIYLIKEEFSSLDRIVNSDRKGAERFDCGDSGTLFIWRNPSKAPSWVKNFFEGELDAQDWITSSVGAVFVAPVHVKDGVIRRFALTFGYGRALLEIDTIERRFGLKCILNVVPPNSLRQIKKTLISGNARKSSEQMPRKSAVAEFSLDYERDLLDGITAVGEKGSLLEGSVSGTDSLTISSEARLSDLHSFLVDIYSAYESDAYKENFAWIDHIAYVRDKSVIAQLESRAVDALNSGDESVWFAVPAVIDWGATAGFRYTPNGETVDDILTEDVLGSLPEQLSDFKQLKRRKIYVIDSKNETVVDSWSISDCLYGEIQLEGEQYCASDGSWYRVEKDYSDTICKEYDETPIASIDFPDYRLGCSGEAEYNHELADSSEDYLLMDKKDVVFGGGGSRVELCDVLSSDGKYIHVKRYGGSSVMSHLFNQGLVSMDLVKSEPKFVEKSNQVISRLDSSNRFSISKEGAHEVIYGIVTKKPGKLPNVPFFSKVAFHHVRKRLESMGVRVSIKSIYDHNK